MHAHFATVMADFGLSPIEGRALFVLDKPLPMGELAGVLHCDASYITGITDRLEQQELVERQVYANDRRVKHLVLTSKGQQLRQAILRRTEQGLPATVGLTSEQCAALRDLLRVSQGFSAQSSVTNAGSAAPP